MEMRADDRYVVISADCHAGASMDTYREWLDADYRDEYDAWREGFVAPFDDLRDTDSVEYRRNFDAAVRIPDLEADGIVGEVIFPNTIPPFFDQSPQAMRGSADKAAHDRAWAGIHAHNRWLADFCADLPGRRAGLAQIRFDDIDRALEELRWVAAEPNLFGGILLPLPSPDSDIPPLHAPVYEPVWSLCEELGIVINTHAGGGLPDFGPYPSTPTMMMLEFAFWAQRPLVRLIMSGVLSRHPELTLIVTETGNDWVPQLIGQLDWTWERLVNAKETAAEFRFSSHIKQEVPMPPSEYWKRQCYLGASFMGPTDTAERYRTGIDQVMWGSDYPHREGTFPHTAEALRWAFAGVDHEEVQMMLGGNAARAYGFDFDTLSKTAALVGPRVGDVDLPLSADDLPSDSTSAAFAPRPPR
jgi:predicted TIM-barrel fold metal-dependent hydrolase